MGDRMGGVGSAVWSPRGYDQTPNGSVIKDLPVWKEAGDGLDMSVCRVLGPRADQNRTGKRRSIRVQIMAAVHPIRVFRGVFGNNTPSIAITVLKMEIFLLINTILRHDFAT